MNVKSRRGVNRLRDLFLQVDESMKVGEQITEIHEKKGEDETIHRPTLRPREAEKDLDQILLFPLKLHRDPVLHRDLVHPHLMTVGRSSDSISINKRSCFRFEFCVDRLQ